MSGPQSNPSEDNMSLSDQMPPMPRYAHEFQKASGSREMVEYATGDWVKWEDVQCFLWFFGGYLQGHREMLEDQRVHPKIIKAVQDVEEIFNRVD